jgi:hypothetical protein
MSKFLAIFLVASVNCLASAESLRSQTNLVLDREKQADIYMFLSGLKSDLLIPFNAIDLLLKEKDLAQDKVKALLSQTKDVLEKVYDDLKEYIDKLEQELSTGTRIQPQ